MTKFDAEFDYLLLLGIDPADTLRAPAVLIEGIKGKKKEWTSQALNPLYAAGARANLERAREFEGLLHEPAALAAYVNYVKQCRVALRAEHEDALMVLIAMAAGGKKEVTARQRELVISDAKSKGIPASLVDEVLKSNMIAVVSSRKAASTEKPKLPLQSPALDSVIMGDIQNWLKVLNKKSLYDLLDLPNTTPPPRLISASQLLFNHWSKVLPKTNTSTAWEKTLQGSLTYLKDAEAKAKYDRALFNQRVHMIVSRIDLMLAGSSFGAEEQASLIRTAVQDFGFSAAVIEQCLAARMSEQGIAIESRPTVIIELQGQVRCRRCGAWNGPKNSLCRECASSLQRKCENPACRFAPMPADAKACPECGLPSVRAIKYRTLLRLADAHLESGSHHAALSVCQLVAQILPGPAVNERLARAGQIRSLASTARAQAATQSWTAAVATLRELAKVAPRMEVPGVPTLEKVVQFLAEATEKLRALPSDTAPIEAAKNYLGVLRRWSDCQEAFQKTRQIAARLEADRDPRRAAQLVGKLLEIRPDDADLSAAAQRLAPLARAAEAAEQQRQTGVYEFNKALRENRLFAAERALQAIEASASPSSPPPGVDEFRRRLAGVQAELAEVKQLASQQTRGEILTQRYLEILSHCRDCREALLALQSVPIDPPEPPEGLSVRREGNRRILSWRPGASGRRASAYVLQRSITRPSSRQVDPPFQTLYEGDALHFSDDEVAHGGVIIRYMVQAVARGRIEVDGTAVRTFDVCSPPATFPGVLVWQEVMNLRSARRDRALELTWFVPPGSRHVFIERWPGGPDDQGLGVAILPATSEGRLLDDGLGEKMVHTYRISCVYDGPEGEFRTPGVCLTDGVVATVAARPVDSAKDSGNAVPSSNGT